MSGEAGPGGASQTARGAAEVVELDAAQEGFARRVAESKATAPHVYFERELRDEAALPALIAASALALGDFPLLNGAYRDGRFELYSRINVGFGVAARGTLVMPVIHDASSKALGAIESECDELAALARAGTITAPQLAGATFAIIDMAAHGASRFTPVIVRGLAATLGAGAAALTLAADNRIVQGADGAAFLARLVGLLG